MRATPAQIKLRVSERQNRGLQRMFEEKIYQEYSEQQRQDAKDLGQEVKEENNE